MIERCIEETDVGILVNNVGRAWFGKYHTIPLEMMFNMVHVNCISQMAMSRYFLNQWQIQRRGKKCAIIDISSYCADAPSGNLVEYSGTKALNSLVSQSIYDEYQKIKSCKDPLTAEHEVDLDVLTVFPASVKTNMNSGRYTFTVTSEQHASAVIDKLGWET